MKGELRQLFVNGKYTEDCEYLKFFMDKKIKKLLKKLKNKKVGVFWDDSNLYHAYQKYGWRVDVKKFKTFFKKRCDLQFINYYLAIPDKSDQCYKGTKKYIDNISPYVKIKTKPLKYIQLGKSSTSTSPFLVTLLPN